MSCQDAPAPSWATPDVWREALAYAEEIRLVPVPPLTIPAGIRRAWTSAHPDVLCLMLANWRAATNSPGDQFGSAGALSIVGEVLGAFINSDLNPVGGAGEDVDIEGLGSVVDVLINDRVQGTNNVGQISTSFVDAAERNFDSLSDQILRILGQSTTSQADSIGSLSRNVINGIGDSSNTAINTLQGLAATILNGIQNNNGQAQNTIVDLFRNTNGRIDELLTGNSRLVEVLQSQALGAITETLGQSNSAIASSFTDIGEAIVPLLRSATDANERSSTAVQTAMQEQIEQSRRNADVAERSLTDAIEAVVTASDSALATTTDTLAATGQGQALATAEGAEEISGSVSTGFENVSKEIKDFAATFGTGTNPEVLNQVKENLSKITELTGCPEEFGPVIQAFILEVFGRFSISGTIAEAQLLLSTFQALIGPVLEVFGNCMAQAAARQVPTALPTIEQIKDQLNRRLIGDTEAVNNLLNQGYSLDRSANLLATRRELPDIGIVQAWWLRGFIDTERATEMLLDLGHDSESIENILRMAFFVPSVGDLITMAVREVFSPDVAQRFGQFEDFPEQLSDFARLQGVSEQWAQRYWAAHWALPSPQQGFEMFQRGVIERDDLNKLLRALDVMPFWRDKLTAIAYRPIPRVDVRRLHALGLITTDNLQQRYEAFGFAPDDAELMKQFTVAYNQRGAGEDSAELAGVTKAQALRFFKAGTITKDQTQQILAAQGLSSEAIDILITSTELEMQEQTRDEQTKLLIEQAKAGAITFTQAEDKLGQLGLEPTELARALTTLQRAQAANTKIPTRTEGAQMLKAGIIDTGQYLDLLQRIGYSQAWSERFLELASGQA